MAKELEARNRETPGAPRHTWPRHQETNQYTTFRTERVGDPTQPAQRVREGASGAPTGVNPSWPHHQETNQYAAFRRESGGKPAGPAQREGIRSPQAGAGTPTQLEHVQPTIKAMQKERGRLRAARQSTEQTIPAQAGSEQPEQPLAPGAHPLKPEVTQARRIYQVLRGEIESGGLAPGSQFYKRHELTERFHTSEGPVADAIHYLRSRGLLEYRRGKGNFVRQPQETDEK